MGTIKATVARANIYKLINHVCETHEPMRVEGKHCSAVLISEEDYSAIQETLYLLSVPNMLESIREGMATPIEECQTELPW